MQREFRAKHRSGSPASHLRPAGEERARWRRTYSRAMVLAVLLHLALFLAVRDALVPEFSQASAGPRADDAAAAAGGGGMQALQVRVAEEPESVTEPVPEPVPMEEVEVVEEPTPSPERAPEAAPAQEAGEGRTESPGLLGEVAGPGPGSAEGERQGQGDGGGGDEGESRVVPPSPRGMILPPPNPPAGVRGREITVWVYVNERGRVVENQTRLEPSTGDRSYDRRLIRSAADWSFDPGREDGRPVAAWYPYQIIF